MRRACSLFLPCPVPSCAVLVEICRESLDVNADNRLPATHRFMFLVNSLLLSAAPVYLFSQIFDMAIPENALIFGIVCVVSAVMLTMACQYRSKNLVARLINKRGIELQVLYDNNEGCCGGGFAPWQMLEAASGF